MDGYLIGESFFDRITYNAWASAGYYDLPDRPGSADRQRHRPGRRHRPLFLMQEASVPFAAGPVKVVPYAKLLLAEYTNDLQGDEIGRVWGGGGVRASIPFTRLYPDVQSELFNLNGINHKIVVSADYFVAGTNVPYTNLPQLDRLNDDATDQAIARPAILQFRQQPDGAALRRDESAVRPAALRHPQTGGQPDRHARQHRRVEARHAPALADEARLSRRPAHRGLDDARPVGDVSSRPPTATTSASRSASWSTTTSGTSATARP